MENRIFRVPLSHNFFHVPKDVVGKYTMFSATDVEEVREVLEKLAEEGASGGKVYIQSGAHSTVDDTVTTSSKDILLDLTGLKSITIRPEERLVEVESGVTVAELAGQLKDQKLVLPLGDICLRSVFSNVFNVEHESYCLRSLGVLRDAVRELHVFEREVTTDQKVQFKRKKITGGELKPYFEQLTRNNQAEVSTIVTSIVFEAKSSQDIMVDRFAMVYEQTTYQRLIEWLSAKTDLPQDLDISLKLASGRFDVPVLLIVIAYKVASVDKKNELKNEIDAVIKAAIKKRCEQEQLRNESEKSVLKKLTSVEWTDNQSLNETILDINDDGAFDVELLPEKYARQGEDLSKFNQTVEEMVKQNNRLSIRLQLQEASKLFVRGFFFLAEKGREELRNTLGIRTPTASRWNWISWNKDGTGPTAKKLLKQLALVKKEAPEQERVSPIERFRKDFKGEYHFKGQKLHQAKAKQYASSSFNQEDMLPFIVAYPKDVEDIKTAIRLAKEQKAGGEKKGVHVVARSGGHAYSGQSSGGEDTIVLSMDLFTKLEPNSQKPGEITVGVGNRLTKAASYFKQNQVTIPHGECPLVAIGGHFQTGGYGHLLRNFGLALDFVKSFRIVTADGEHLNVERPEREPKTTSEKDNGEKEKQVKLFSSVLGGGPGSWGVVTDITFDCIKDQDYGNSYGFGKKFFYSKSLFFDLMKQVQEWTQVITDPANSHKLDHIDLCLSAVSRNFLSKPFHPAVIVCEMVQSKPTPENTVYFNKVKDVVKDRLLSNILLPSDEGRKSLSYWSDSFVRRSGTTEDGREFPFPYVKRVNCTKAALTDDFIREFVDRIHRVLKDYTFKVKLVFQMFIGGGKLQTTETREITSIPHRDLVYGLVFDLFYTKPEYKRLAEQLQEDMHNLLEEHFQNPELRVFWGSFGDKDMKRVWNHYYDSEHQYKNLQQIKRELDPDDIFHTSFTVQLP